MTAVFIVAALVAGFVAGALATRRHALTAAWASVETHFEWLHDQIDRAESELGRRRAADGDRRFRLAAVNDTSYHSPKFAEARTRAANPVPERRPA